jgi:hypothetical protein
LRFPDPPFKEIATMSNMLITQWVEMGQASLAALKQMSESAAAGFGSGLQPGLGQSDLAVLLKAFVDTNQQLGDMTTAVFTNLFYSQLKLFNPAGSGAALQELTDSNTEFVKSFVEKQMAATSEFTAMFTAFLSDLQASKSANDIALLQSDLFNKIEQRVKDNSADLGQLLMSAKTAASAWTDRTLNRAIAQDNADATANPGNS